MNAESNLIRPDLARKIRERRVAQFGSFRLVTHEVDPAAPVSPIYFDFGAEPDGPVSASLLEELVAGVLSPVIRLENLMFASVAGIPNTMNPYAKLLAELYGVPQILLEKESKGVIRVPEGTVIPPGPVLVAEDAITRAISSLSGVMALREAGATVYHVVAFVDREQGGVRALRDAGVTACVAWRLRTQLLQFWLDNELSTLMEYRDTMVYLNTTQAGGTHA